MASAYFYNETRVKITSFDSRKQHTSRHALDIASFFSAEQANSSFPFFPFQRLIFYGTAETASLFIYSARDNIPS